GCDKAYFLVHSRRIENTQESPNNNLVHSLGSQRQGIQAVESLSRGNDGVMVRDLFVVYIACFDYIFVCTRRKDLFRGRGCHRIPFQSGNIFVDFLRHSGGEDTGVCPGISNEFFLIKLLDHAQGDRKSTRLNSSHVSISYAVFCLKKKN